MSAASDQARLSRCAVNAVKDLERDGYSVLSDCINPDVIASINAELDPRFALTPWCEGRFYGETTKRFGCLLKRSQRTSELVRHSLILEIVDAFLSPWCSRFNLNLTQAIEIHPGALPQFPHRDQDMWQGPKGEVEYLINVIWPLTDFTADNGATVIWPGSHLRQYEVSMPTEDAVAIIMQPGSALIFLGSTLHGGGSNITAFPRRGIIISYCLGWLKPFENQWLAYLPDVARDFDPELASLVGYSQHHPNLGNYEGQCPSILLGAPPGDYLAATDALRPDQARLLAEYVAEQIASIS